MLKLKQTLFFLLFLSSLGAQPLKARVGAKSAILFNPENGAILFQKQPHILRPPASLTKIPTALFLLDHKKIDLVDYAVASDEAIKVIYAPVKQAEPEKFPAYLLEHDGVNLGLVKGEKQTYHALLHALMLLSANDVANVLAENTSKSMDGFMEELNGYLAEMGITHSKFKNSHGLFHPEQKTTAFEMAKITARALKNKIFREIVSRETFDFPGTHFREEKTISNFNALLKEGKYHYPKAIGVKTGYTSRAGANLVAAAEHEGRLLIAVLLGYYDDSNERFKDAIALFETAFREKPVKRMLFTKEFSQFSREMPKAKEPLKALLDQDIEIEYFPAEEKDLSAQLIWETEHLPIFKNQRVGSLAIVDENGLMVASCPLFAGSKVEKKAFYYFWDFIRENGLFFLIGFGYLLWHVIKRFKKREELL